MRRWYVIVAIVVVLLGVAAYFVFAPGAMDPFRSVQRVTDEDKVNEMALAFVSAPYTDDYQVMRVPGWFDNLSKSEMRAARLEIQLLDEDGAKKEKITYDLKDIPAQTRKTFDINAGTISGARDATIKVVWVEVYK